MIVALHSDPYYLFHLACAIPTEVSTTTPTHYRSRLDHYAGTLIAVGERVKLLIKQENKVLSTARFPQTCIEIPAPRLKRWNTVLAHVCRIRAHRINAWALESVHLSMFLQNKQNKISYEHLGYNLFCYNATKQGLYDIVSIQAIVPCVLLLVLM